MKNFSSTAGTPTLVILTLLMTLFMTLFMTLSSSEAGASEGTLCELTWSGHAPGASRLEFFRRLRLQAHFRLGIDAQSFSTLTQAVHELRGSILGPSNWVVLQLPTPEGPRIFSVSGAQISWNGPDSVPLHLLNRARTRLTIQVDAQTQLSWNLLQLERSGISLIEGFVAKTNPADWQALTRAHPEIRMDSADRPKWNATSSWLQAQNKGIEQAAWRGPPGPIGTFLELVRIQSGQSALFKSALDEQLGILTQLLDSASTASEPPFALVQKTVEMLKTAWSRRPTVLNALAEIQKSYLYEFLENFHESSEPALTSLQNHIQPIEGSTFFLTTDSEQGLIRTLSLPDGSTVGVVATLKEGQNTPRTPEALVSISSGGNLYILFEPPLKKSGLLLWPIRIEEVRPPPYSEPADE